MIAPDNAAFWNELCGTAAARRLGVNDESPSSLMRFDQWYFGFYPYLERRIPFHQLAGKRVLEVGLGYGSVAQRLGESGTLYHGLDIAANPVAMVRHRLRQLGLDGEVKQGSILECPWPDAFFDHVVAIGCYHHTGDMPRAIAETSRVLKPGGGASLMVYNAYSYRRWLRWPGATTRTLLAEISGGERPPVSDAERAAYDVSLQGCAPPETAFVSAGALRTMMAGFSEVSIAKENIGSELFLSRIPRRFLLAALGGWCGLDLYVSAVK